MIEMPRGTTPTTAPCRARPTINPMMPGESAAITDPAIITASRTRTMRRLPYISPRRPAIGVMTAAASSVDVTTQAVSSLEAFRSSGSFAWIGTTRVNRNDEHRPATASTATTAPFGVLRDSLLRAFSSRDIGSRLSVPPGSRVGIPAGPPDIETHQPPPGIG